MTAYEIKHKPFESCPQLLQLAIKFGLIIEEMFKIYWK